LVLRVTLIAILVCDRASTRSQTKEVQPTGGKLNKTPPAHVKSGRDPQSAEAHDKASSAGKGASADGKPGQHPAQARASNEPNDSKLDKAPAAEKETDSHGNPAGDPQHPAKAHISNVPDASAGGTAPTTEGITKSVRKIAKRELKQIKREKSRDEERQRSVRQAVNRARHSKVVKGLEMAANKQEKKLSDEVDHLRVQQQAESRKREQQAQEQVMAIYHQQAKKLLEKGDGPDSNPFTSGAEKVLNPWYAADPSLNLIATIKPQLTTLDAAVDEAERMATRASDSKAQLFKAIADHIKRVSSSQTGEQLEKLSTHGSVLVRGKARAALDLIILQAYNDGFGTKGNPYHQAYICAKAHKSALDVLKVGSNKHPNNFCRTKLYRAETNLRIQAAASAALKVASESTGKACSLHGMVSQRLQLATYEAKAVKTACANIKTVRSLGPQHAAQRQAIRSRVAQLMTIMLKKTDGEEKPKDTKLQKEEKSILKAAKQAWQDVHQFSVGSPIPNGLDVRPKP